jgi:hypothetical protein
MLSLDSLIGVTMGNIPDNISLHSIPPIGYLETMVHLIPSWVNEISRFMGLSKYLVL